METLIINAKTRSKDTKGTNNRMREQGEIPAVLYGKEMDNVAISVSEKLMDKIIAQAGEGVFAKLVVEDDGNSNEYNVIVKEVQRHPVRKTLSHIDFNQVSMTEKINTVAPIAIIGESVGVNAGGIAQQPLRELDISCLPGNIPTSIEVDISSLDIGEAITVGDLEIDEGIEILTDPSSVIITITAPTIEAEDEEDDGDAEDVEGAEEVEETEEQ